MRLSCGRAAATLRCRTLTHNAAPHPRAARTSTSALCAMWKGTICVMSAVSSACDGGGPSSASVSAASLALDAALDAAEGDDDTAAALALSAAAGALSADADAAAAASGWAPPAASSSRLALRGQRQVKRGEARKG